MTTTDDARQPAGSFADILPTYASEPLVPTIHLFRDHTITLPRGHVVVLFGPGGVGKGMLSVDFAARNSRGENAAGEPGTTFMVTPEDDINETVAWRLRAAGADTRRVIDKTTLSGGAPFRLGAAGGAGSGMAKALTTAMTVGELRGDILALQEYDDKLREAGETDPALYANPTLVIIEPLLACTDGGSLATDAGARSVLAPLQELAADTGVCVLITHHSTKGGGDIAGSRAMLNAPRIVYEIARKKGEPFAQITLNKANIMGLSGSSRYAIVGEGTDAHVAWADKDGNIIGRVPQIDGLPAWRARALAGPLTAIQGAELRPVAAFEEMSDAERLLHLGDMHGMPAYRAQALASTPGYLREMLVNLHRIRHDQMAVVPHRHAEVPLRPKALEPGRKS